MTMRMIVIMIVVMLMIVVMGVPVRLTVGSDRRFLVVALTVESYPHGNGVDAAQQYRIGLDIPAGNGQGSQACLECFQGHAAVEQGAERHVTSDTGKTIEISNGHKGNDE